MTKVVAFNGSPRDGGNTSILIGEILDELREAGIETEEVQIGRGRVKRGCTACMKCFENRDSRCVFDDDIVNSCIVKMREADGIILGSPVYFLDITAEMKGLIDRAGLVSMANNDLYRKKVGAVVTAVRRAGGSNTLDSMLHFLLFSKMVVAGAPVLGVGRNIGDVRNDAEGMQRARETGQTLAWLLRSLEKAKDS